MKHQTVQPSIDKHRVGQFHTERADVTKQRFSLNAQCHKDYFRSFCIQSYAHSDTANSAL